MRAVIFLNGDIDVSPETAASGADMTVCADGAFDRLRGVVVPTAIIGDFDSVTRKDFPSGSRVISYPPEKDHTDGELCVAYAIESGASELDIYGAFGGPRPDHQYGNTSLLYLAKKRGAFARLLTQEWEVTLRNGAFALEAKKGGYVSLAPFFERTHILSTKGLKYSAADVVLSREQSLGLSNEATSDEVEVATEGETLVFVER